MFSAKIEKEKKQLAKDAGFIKTEVSGAEVNVCIVCEVCPQKTAFYSIIIFSDW